MMADPDPIDQQRELLSTHRRRLAQQLRQAARLGDYAPPHVAIDIEDARAEIRDLKALLRGQQIAVDDHPDDEPRVPTEKPVPAALSPDTRSRPSSPPAESRPPRPLRVFLCHAFDDKPVVRALYQRLRAEGIEPWFDEESLLPGQDWQQEIPKAVRAADAVLVCLSRQAISKVGYIQREIRYALDVADEQPEGAVFIIPLKLEDCEVPGRLQRWQWVNLFEERGYERLMRALQARAAAVGASATALIEPRLRGVRILLVEDDPSFAQHIALLLQKAAGAIVEIETSAGQAMSRLNAQPAPDMVLTNHELRGQATGTDLARWIYVQPQLKRTLRISFSARAPQETLKEAPPGLFHAAIDKTRPILQLMAQLGDLVQHHGLSPSAER